MTDRVDRINGRLDRAPGGNCALDKGAIESVQN